MRQAWLILLLLAAAYYWFQPTADKPEKPVSTVESKQTPRPAPVRSTSQPRTPKPAPPLQMQTLPRQLENSDSSSPQKQIQSYVKQGFAAFNLEEGLAIAYGDMILGKPVGDGTIEKGLAKPPTPQPWKGAEIAYALAPDLAHPERVEQALAYFNEYTPIQFVPLTKQKDGILFERSDLHCASYVGRIGGIQPIRLSERCEVKEILHEIMHALGFVHEHSRSDRDQFVQVIWQNIDPEYYDQFAQVPDQLMTLQKGTEFDYTSIMIYPVSSFAKDKISPTLTSLNPAERIEPSQGLSPGDLERINRAFKR